MSLVGRMIILPPQHEVIMRNLFNYMVAGAEDPKARKKSDDVAEVRMQFTDFDGTEYQLERGDPNADEQDYNIVALSIKLTGYSEIVSQCGADFVQQISQFAKYARPGIAASTAPGSSKQMFDLTLVADLTEID